MKPFHTIGMIAFLLLFVGIDTIIVALKNQSPTMIELTQMIYNGPPKKWVRVTRGILDPKRVIIANSARNRKLEQAYLPLVRAIGDVEIDVIILTRDPLFLDFLNDHQRIEATQNKEAASWFFESRIHEFEVPRDVTGMASAYGEMTSRTRRKLRDTYVDLAEMPILIKEGESPSAAGPLLTALGVLSGALSVYLWRRSKKTDSGELQPPPWPNPSPPPLPQNRL